MIQILCHVGTGLALIYNMWISFIVLDDRFGLLVSLGGVVVFPITAWALPIAMFFFSSEVAGTFALWPAIILIGILQGIAWRLRKREEEE